MKSQHIKILMVINNDDVHKQLQQYKITEQIGEDKIFFSEIEAIEFAKASFKNRVKKKYFD